LIANKRGVLYGTTSGGTNTGRGSDGNVFSLHERNGKWSESPIYLFTGGEDGSAPTAALAEGKGGILYGTTVYGGAISEQKKAFEGGTVFSLTPPAPGSSTWTEDVIYRFSQESLHQPFGNLIVGPKGVLYGTTSYDGNNQNGGVFELSPPIKGQGNWTETTLYTFQGGTDGANPTAGLLMDAAGNLYGTTSNGGGFTGNGACQRGCGIVFELSPPSEDHTGWTETILHAFTSGQDGAIPLCTLISDGAGNLYGTTAYGGLPSDGVVFELSPPAAGKTEWTEAILYAFQGSDSDTEGPNAGVVWGPDGSLYGTGCCGPGINGAGAVFELTPPALGQTTWAESLVYDFKGSPDGQAPLASIIFDSSGNIFGTTKYGGDKGRYPKNNFGTVFEITP
jgi:uncharacterized repeat protein (TIGR03803 family)